MPHARFPMPHSLNRKLAVLASLMLVFLPGTPTRVGAQQPLAQAETSEEARSLELDKPVEKQIGGGEIHTYQVAVEAGQYLSIAAEQQGIDVQMKLLAPGGETLDESDSYKGFQGLEEIFFIASAPGVYRIQVQPVLEEPAPGRYTVKILEQQPPSEQQQARFAAKLARKEGDRLYKQETAEGYNQSIAKYAEALQLYRTAGDRNGEGNVLYSIATAQNLLGNKQQALENYSSALSVWRELKDPTKEAFALWSIASVYSYVSEFQKAIDTYNQALPLFRAVGLDGMASLILMDIGHIYRELGEKQKAIETYNQMLGLYEARGDANGQAIALRRMGEVYYFFGEKKKALEAFNRAQALDPQSEQPSAEPESAAALKKAVAFSWEETQKTIEYLKQALAAERASGNRQLEAQLLTLLGIVYNSWGEYRQALDSYSQALEMHRAVGNRLGAAATLTSIADVYLQTGEYQQALDSYSKALEVQQAMGDRDGQAETLGNIASAYKILGDYPLSLNYYNRALSAYRDAGHLDGEAKTLDNIGGVYGQLGDYPKASDFANQALAIWREQSDLDRQAIALGTLARLYESSEEYQKLLDTASEIAAIGRETGNRVAEGSGITLAGRAYRALGEYQKAIESYSQGLQIYRDRGDRSGEAALLYLLGSAYEASGDGQKAIASYSSARSLWQELGDRASVADSLYSIAAAERKQDNLDNAIARVSEAIAIVEDLRANVASSELRASYFATVQKYYELKIDLLMQQHRQNPAAGYDAKAIETSENSRARSLLEILNEARADIRAGVEPQLLDNERNLRRKLEAMEQRRLELLSSQPTDEQKAQLDKEIGETLAQYQEVRAQIRSTSPRYAALTQPQPLSLKDIQQQVLDENTLLLEYSLGEERSYLWAVTKTGITSYELPKRADIEAAAKRLRTALTAPSQRTNLKQVQNAASALGEIILKPAASQLGNKRLLIVADGALQYIPFAALSVPEKPEVPLVVEHEIVNLPSASTLAILRRDLAGRKPAPKTLAAIADPIFNADDERIKGETSGKLPLEAQQLERAASDAGINWSRLPYTRKEAEQILALVPENERSIAFDFAANRAAAISEELSQYRLLHFATHGFANSEKPELSGIVLSLLDEKGQLQNGYLRLHEIYNLNLNADLVVLSACQTGLGKEIKGEGLVSLTRGFMYAGAPRVVVSLWSVSDEATAELMVKFYQKMLKDGLAPAAALRAAQIEFMQQTEWKSPYFWAAFGLQGEWK